MKILGESVNQDLFQDISFNGNKKLPSISYNHQEYTFAHSPWLNPENLLNSILEIFDKPSKWMMKAGLYFAVFSMIIWIISVIIVVIKGIYTWYKTDKNINFVKAFMFGAFNIFSASVFNNMMNRTQRQQRTDNITTNIIYPDLRQDRTVLNEEHQDRTTIPPLYNRIDTRNVRTFGEYPTTETRFVDGLHIPVEARLDYSHHSRV